MKNIIHGPATPPAAPSMTQATPKVGKVRENIIHTPAKQGAKK